MHTQERFCSVYILIYAPLDHQAAEQFAPRVAHCVGPAHQASNKGNCHAPANRTAIDGHTMPYTPTAFVAPGPCLLALHSRHRRYLRRQLHQPARDDVQISCTRGHHAELEATPSLSVSVSVSVSFSLSLSLSLSQRLAYLPLTVRVVICFHSPTRPHAITLKHSNGPFSGSGLTGGRSKKNLLSLQDYLTNVAQSCSRTLQICPCLVRSPLCWGNMTCFFNPFQLMLLAVMKRLEKSVQDLHLDIG